MKLPRSLISGILLLLSCIIYGNSAQYESRRNNYITNALANFGPDVITLQAYQGLPVDGPALTALCNGIPTSVTPDFDLVKLVRILYFTDTTYESQILPAVNSIPYWINYGDTTRVFWSENHMSMWMSSDWLLHERYGKPVDPYLRNRLVHYLHLKTQYGYYEFFSSVYNPYCLTGLLNLADFAQDAEIKNLAILAAQRLMKSLLLLTNDQGVFYPTAGRNYDDKYEQPYGQNHNDLIWLLTGFGQAPGGGSHAGGFLASSTVPVDTVVDSWVPVLDTIIHVGHTIEQGLALNDSMSSVDSVIFGWSAGEYFHPLLALASFELMTDSNLWNHPDFAPFSALRVLAPQGVVPAANSLNCASESSVICNDTLAIYKHNSVTLSSVQNFWPGKLGYQEYPCVANVGTTAVYTASGKVIADWSARSADEANDDLPYVKQTKNVALLMYRAQYKPAIVGASYPQVSLHFKTADFSEIRQDSLWLLARQNNNYVGVRRNCEGQINSLYACDIPNGQAWVIIVGDSLTYGTFDHFQQVIDSSVFTELWYYDTANQQEVFYAGINIDSISIDHAWGVDSTLPLGVNAINEVSFGIFPNPAADNINIQIPNTLFNSTLHIFNCTGQMVYQTRVNSSQTTIPTSDLSEGIYAVRLISGDGNYGSRCFVISRTLNTFR